MIASCGERKPAANAARLMFGDQTDQPLGVSPRFLGAIVKVFAPCASFSLWVPPHPACGHLLPGGEKGLWWLMFGCLVTTQISRWALAHGSDQNRMLTHSG